MDSSLAGCPSSVQQETDQEEEVGKIAASDWSLLKLFELLSGSTIILIITLEVRMILQNI